MDPPRPPPKFTPQEWVLCFRGYLLYEGKLLKSEFRKDRMEWVYRVRCPGGNEIWDEWIWERRILKYCDMSLLGEVDAGHRDNRVSVPAVDSSSGSSTPVRDKGSGHIIIPENLNLILVEDWNAVTRLKRRPVLPAKVPLERILKEYLDGMDEGVRKRAASELCKGLRKHFTSLIGTDLLYGLEMEQFQDLLTKIGKKKLTEHYGLPHLMRLCGKFSDSPDSNSESKAAAMLNISIKEFLGFLSEKSDVYYSMQEYYM